MKTLKELSCKSLSEQILGSPDAIVEIIGEHVYNETVEKVKKETKSKLFYELSVLLPQVLSHRINSCLQAPNEDSYLDALDDEYSKDMKQFVYDICDEVICNIRILNYPVFIAKQYVTYDSDSSQTSDY